jgi:hypothetical protein
MLKVAEEGLLTSFAFGEVHRFSAERVSCLDRRYRASVG